MEAGEVGLLSRSGRLRCHKELFYSLEEDMDDWNLEKMVHAATALFSDERYCHVRHLLTGNALHTQPVSSFDWVKGWLARDDQEMNPAQQQALLRLLYSRGYFLFLGDENQLPPIVMGTYDDEENGEDRKDGVRFSNSILSNIRNQYPACYRVTLNTTYRMNREICAFPSKIWYGSVLSPAPGVDRARLYLDPVKEEYNDPFGNGRWFSRILDPEKPVTLVLTDHQGSSQQSDEEADLMAALACRLLCGHGFSQDRMAIITPPQGPG